MDALVPGWQLNPYHSSQVQSEQEVWLPSGHLCTASADGRRGSNVYEVNQWLWQFGRGKPRLGGLSVQETDDRKDASQKERIERGAETRRRSKADRA